MFTCLMDNGERSAIVEHGPDGVVVKLKSKDQTITATEKFRHLALYRAIMWLDKGK